mgnify:CR=1 FL=1
MIRYIFVASLLLLEVKDSKSLNNLLSTTYPFLFFTFGIIAQFFAIFYNLYIVGEPQITSPLSSLKSVLGLILVISLSSVVKASGELLYTSLKAVSFAFNESQ